MSEFKLVTIECIKDLFSIKNNAKYLFRKGNMYPVRVYGKFATVQDETDCFRELYCGKNDQLYREFFKPLSKADIDVA